MLTLNAEVV